MRLRPHGFASSLGLISMGLALNGATTVVLMEPAHWTREAVSDLGALDLPQLTRARWTLVGVSIAASMLLIRLTLRRLPPPYLLALGTGSAITLVLAVAVSASSQAGTPPPVTDEPPRGFILVKFAEGVSPQRVVGDHGGGAAKLSPVFAGPYNESALETGLDRHYVLTVTNGTERAAADEYARDPRVESAQAGPPPGSSRLALDCCEQPPPQSATRYWPLWILGGQGFAIVARAALRTERARRHKRVVPSEP